MTSLSVWSPAATRVDARLPDGPVPMFRGDDGWWRVDVPLEHGDDYAFVVDGGDPRPDPRSRWQPHGVHGSSRVYDHDRFTWDDDGWRGIDIGGRLFYELHVGTFTPGGTLDDVHGRLDHLVELGVDVVELMPVNSFPGHHNWGYDGVALFAVHEPYGGPDALKRLVDACHARGLAVALDVVYNHLGPSGNYLREFGPYFTERHQTPWGAAVNLDDDGSDEARQFFVDNALMWLRDFHVDVLRLDAVHALVDDSDEHVLAQLSREVDQLAADLGRPLSLVAESDLNQPSTVAPREAGGHGMTAQWSDDFHHALHALLTGEDQGYYGDFAAEPYAALHQTLTAAFFHAGTWSTFRGSEHGAPVDRSTAAGHQFLGYLQDHDQVGNRAVGDRITATISTGLAEIGAALVLTSPFTPMLFMGEEWAASTPWQFFTDHQEAELATAVRDGRRREFAEHGWSEGDVPDPQDQATYERSTLDWSELETEPHERVLAWHRRLISLRRNEPDLRDDRLDRVQVVYDASARWVVVHRGGLRVVANLSDADREIPLDGDPSEILADNREVRITPGALSLPAESVAVIRMAG